ncbi:C-GCAxxG-C-C family protein [Campylobacter curvus]|uniref:C-GCAxxG-C-C family protein n=1 Tax=Campylobacter curvus TaxID=200 RepID=UPI000371ABC0|nr:C-GCAxxG-C-C family protein [Campylobacter curvus]QKF62128.1 C_GCAxxG_C_C family protein [Campylobacter curvus]UEB50415.1 C-GCAxxG-C-C family protein [Campylobacter curvus]
MRADMKAAKSEGVAGARNLQKLTTEQIAAKFSQINCAQVLFERYAGALNLDEKRAICLGAGLGGGLREGLTCDTYLAAVLVLGLKFGEEKAKFEAKLAEFQSAYFKKWNSKICREILGFDLSKPDEMAQIQKRGLFKSVCPCVVRDCIEILDEILGDAK